ncbi:hypothetical protein GALMADRAFT_217973 [Galerina marginata CBS 339.88]|uniref:Protein kinase domain-containing protein n=1 Tax=Galerina marginata (strain CBS 339.88) TaxID=685588 RepID=A0A067U0N3_GALM3|nr:hypothetical protein GALMADRAFT_217973 [Galerina marginata CBS 339.88]
MSEDSRSTKLKKVYYVANPGSGDSDDAKEEYIRGTGRNAYSTKRSLPQMYSVTNIQYHKSTPSQPNLVTTDLPVTTSHYQQGQPPLSPDSTSSPTTSTPPPATPGLHAPSSSVDLQPRLESPSKPSPIPESTTVSYPEYRNYTENPPQTTSRKGRLLQHLKAPFGSRPLKSSAADGSSSRRPRTSPTVPTPDSYTPTTTVPSTSTPPEKVIFVTSDSERYVTVDISSAKNAIQIRELILTKLNIYNEDELNPYSIYRTEIGSYAIGDVLTNERLFALCRDQGDSRGTLKFFVSHSSAPVHEPPPPAQPVEYNPIPPVLPHLANINPLRVDRINRRSRSRNGSFSSTSENLPLEVAAGYEADLDYPDRETSRPAIRSSHSQVLPPPQGSNGHPPSPRRRPSLAHHPRPSSPLLQSSEPAATPPPQPSQPSDRSWSQRKEEKYGYTLPPVPAAPPPLSPNRPSFSLQGEPPSLTVPQHRQPHSRSASDAAADQDSATMAAEQSAESAGKQLRNRDYPPLGKLRPTRDSGKDRQARRTYDAEDASWEIVLPSGGRPADELDRISPSVSRGTRQPHSSRYDKPNFSYASRNFPPRPAPPVPSTTLPIQDARPPSQPRPARVPVPGTVFVNWKGEEGGHRKAAAPSASSHWPANRLAKNMTKSMDNLKLSGHSSSSRRNAPPPPQVPIRPPTNPSRELPYSPSLTANSTLTLSGIAKSYEPPRAGFTRPLPVQGSPHGPSSDFNQGSATQYSLRGGSYSSSLMSPGQDPFPRPQSAAGDSMTSPTRGYSRLQSPIYGSTLDSGESNRSPRTISPNRAYHSSGIPGPRPRPTNYSNHSDRSSDIQSGPESTTTPPRTPISPQSPRYDSSEKNGNGFLVEPSPPSSPDSPVPVKERNSELTLKQEDQTQFSKMIKTAGQETLVSSHSQARPTRQLTPPPPSSQSNSLAEPYGPDDDDDDSDNGGGTWIVRPVAATSSSRPPLTVHIENPTGTRTAENGTHQSVRPPEVPPKDTLTSSYRPVPTVTAPRPSSSRRPESTFIDAEADNWAPRPPPENIYDHLEKFFPKHDLDKPVIEATSGDTSPTTAEPTAAMLPPPTPVNDDRARIRAKKSIRIVAQEHKKRIDRTSRATDRTLLADNMMRKRSTKLWGSKLEEVTTAQGLGRGVSSTSLPESPSGGPTTFKWVRGELIGKGTYGRVYLALNATTGEMIAVKQVELPQTLSDKNDSRQHTVVQALKMESETLRDLDHPHIVQYLGFEETPANLSIFLEYVPGGSVGSCLHKHGKFDDNVTRSFTAQILSGLEYLHSKGILHRDLKADNILVEMSGTCKISDFGISKRTEDLHGGAFTAMQGTVFWMAPEVINTQKKGYNFKIDIWSVGCVVLEMWQGMRPWMGEEMVAVMFKLYQSKQPPPVPDDVVLSEEADDFRRKCFAINPEERPSAAELRKHPYLILPPGWVFTGFT